MHKFGMEITFVWFQPHFSLNFKIIHGYSIALKFYMHIVLFLTRETGVSGGAFGGGKNKNLLRLRRPKWF